MSGNDTDELNRLNEEAENLRREQAELSNSGSAASATALANTIAQQRSVKTKLEQQLRDQAFPESLINDVNKGRGLPETNAQMAIILQKLQSFGLNSENKKKYIEALAAGISMLPKAKADAATSEAGLEDPEDLKNAEANAESFRNTPEYTAAQQRIAEAAQKGEEPSPEDVATLAKGTVSILARTELQKLKYLEGQALRETAQAKAFAGKFADAYAAIGIGEGVDKKGRKLTSLDEAIKDGSLSHRLARLTSFNAEEITELGLTQADVGQILENGTKLLTLSQSADTYKANVAKLIAEAKTAQATADYAEARQVAELRATNARALADELNNAMQAPFVPFVQNMGNRLSQGGGFSGADFGNFIANAAGVGGGNGVPHVDCRGGMRAVLSGGLTGGDEKATIQKVAKFAGVDLPKNDMSG
jgi:hypothetical protein